MRSSEFFISHIIDKIPTPGEILERWPLHLTVVPPFEIFSELSEDTILEHIAQNGRTLGEIKLGYGTIRSGTIPIEVGNKAMFGESEDIPVIEILDPSNKLHELHCALLKDLGKIGCKFLNLNPEWTGINYSPHVTMKSGKELDRPFFCTTLTLCKKDKDGKTIVDTVKLCD